MADTVAPNIFIILDNSGSMNYNAYGAWPGDNHYVDDAFAGEPYHIIDSRVAFEYNVSQ
jgi:hypothetical protein